MSRAARVRHVATVAAAFAVMPAQIVSAQSLTTDKRDYRHDEPILVRYSAPSGARTSGITARIDEGPCNVPFWSTTPGAPGEGTFRLLAGQGPAGSECHVTIQLVADGRTVASKAVRVLRALAPSPGVLADVPVRHPVMRPMRVSLHGTGSLDSVHAHSLRFKLLRLGRALPGGAVVRENVLVDRLLTAGDASIDVPGVLLSRIGPYEARVVGAGGAIIDRRPIAIVAPEAEQSITLEPDPGNRPYPSDAPPRLALALPGYTQSPGTNIGIALWRIDRGDTPVEWKSIIVPGSPSRDDDRRMVREFLREMAVPLVAGTYDLVVSVAGIVIGRRRIEVAGRPTAAAPTFAPAVDFGVVTLTIVQGTRLPAGATVDVSVTAVPAGVPAPGQKLYLMLVRPEHYTWYCSLARAESIRGSSGTYAWAEVASDGRGRFAAPKTTGPWELRLYRGEGHPGDVWARRGELLAKRRFDVIAPLRTGPQLDSNGERATVEPIVVSGVQPGPPAPARPLDLVRAAAMHVGGAVAETGRTSRSVEGARATLGTVSAGGRYEVRQLAPAYHLDTREETTRETMYSGRTILDVASVAFPSLRRESAPAEMQDWPEPDDPVRGVRQWLKPDSECREPTFAQAPLLRMVKLVHDTKTDERRYVPVDGVFPGHPYFVEAEFQTAPPEERYRVKVGADERVEIRRTADPRRYRSGVVTIRPGGDR